MKRREKEERGGDLEAVYVNSALTIAQYYSVTSSGPLENVLEVCFQTNPLRNVIVVMKLTFFLFKI